MATASLRKVHSDTATKNRAKPFLKWVGGKTQLLPHILDLFPKNFNRYHEPFVGGGAVFFSLEPKKAILSDVNPDLIGAYQMIRDDVDSVIAELKQHRAEEAYYYSVRETDVAELSAAEAAARIIYLNKTCFNGLYRVNRRGKFNVPFGKYVNPTICNEANLRAVSEALQGVDVRLQSVFELNSRVKKNDLVYFDPPYVPLSPTASFTSYTKQGFGEHQQRELAELFGKLVDKGAHCFLSNSDTPLVRELYKDFRIKKVYARRAINSRADRRGPVGEVIVCSN